MAVDTQVTTVTVVEINDELNGTKVGGGAYTLRLTLTGKNGPSTSTQVELAKSGGDTFGVYVGDTSLQTHRLRLYVEGDAARAALSVLFKQAALALTEAK